MLEITPQDISTLTDTDLRILIGRLCEAELRQQNISSRYVTYGGDQNAKDGGLDVRVELTEESAFVSGYIPRKCTGYQVKAQDLAHKAIVKEMCPAGTIRPVIEELCTKNGSYIIVSSESNISDSALKNRKSAMKEAISSLPIRDNLHTDFYDQTRIASWVRNHPSLVIWVRNKIGRPFEGWKSYENWSNPTAGIHEEYLIEQDVRIFDGSFCNENGLTVINGINRFREYLSSSGKAIRFVGLSGVGKTRLIQALFDERIGKNPLNRLQVIYADASNDLNPVPLTLAEILLSQKQRTVLIIDNCPQDLHTKLAKVCSGPSNSISLLTVEYDVREDFPEQTTVIRLEPSSNALIEKLIQRRFNHISQPDCKIIAEFSGGNARIAIALADTVGKGDSINGLTDDGLFRRLFHQRHTVDDNLLEIAEVCSLVYSFNTQTENVEQSELEILAGLINKNTQMMQRNSAELQRRGLLQKRNVWMAVLPQAIANRLAQRALQNIPENGIISAFTQKGRERILKSFSRRLGYLHNCKEAKVICNQWLMKGNLLGDVSNLNELGITLLKNIAPTAQEAVLVAIECAAYGANGSDFFSHKNYNYSHFTHLLRSLCYESKYFERSMTMLIKFALSEKTGENDNSDYQMLKSLYHIYLSGTHASAQMRLKIIKDLSADPDVNHNRLALELLNAGLETFHFSGHYNFEFGAHSRDYGYHPQSRDEIQEWFVTFYEFLESLALSDSPIANKAKKVIADKFRRIWHFPKIAESLYKLTKSFLEKGPWTDGRTAIKETIRYESEKMPPLQLGRLKELDTLMQPNSLLDKARIYITSTFWSLINDEEEDEGSPSSRQDNIERISTAIRETGQEVIKNVQVLKELLPEMFNNSDSNLHLFGIGLAEGSIALENDWNILYKQFSVKLSQNTSFSIMVGFLQQAAKIDKTVSDNILDQAVNDSVLATIYPHLQSAVIIDKNGIQRLHKSIEIGIAPIASYQFISIRSARECIDDEDYCQLIQKITEKKDSLNVALDILHLSFYDQKQDHSVKIKKLGQSLLSQLVFVRENRDQRHDDYVSSQVAEVCLQGECGELIAKGLCDKIFVALKNYDISNYLTHRLLCTLAKLYPDVLLNAFYDFHLTSSNSSESLFDCDPEFNQNPFSLIPEATLVSWCNIDPEHRYTVAAIVIIPFVIQAPDKTLKWTQSALALINNAPKPTKVLNEFKKMFHPSFWSGSISFEMERRLPLFLQLKDHENILIVNWISSNEEGFKTSMKIQLEEEQKDNRNQFERFE
jgi:hypothetical protein